MQTDSGQISVEIARFRATGDPRHACRALRLVVRQGRTCELLIGAYWLLRHRPPAALPAPAPAVRALASAGERRLVGMDWWDRQAIATHLARGSGLGPLALAQLPSDFAGARREAIACQPGLVVIGEYGHNNKRLCWFSDQGCHVTGFYCEDPAVRHVHAVFPIGPGEFLVSTGDSARYLDAWRFDGKRASLTGRRTRKLGGHTAIARVGGRLYLGSDWSSRPNYLECEDGRRHLVPQPASAMYAVAFAVPDDHHLVTLHKSLSVLGGEYAISVFDTRSDRFVHCARCAAAELRQPAQLWRNPMPLRASGLA